MACSESEQLGLVACHYHRAAPTPSSPFCDILSLVRILPPPWCHPLVRVCLQLRNQQEIDDIKRQANAAWGEKWAGTGTDSTTVDPSSQGVGASTTSNSGGDEFDAMRALKEAQALRQYAAERTSPGSGGSGNSPLLRRP